MKQYSEKLSINTFHLNGLITKEFIIENMSVCIQGSKSKLKYIFVTWNIWKRNHLQISLKIKACVSYFLFFDQMTALQKL